MESLSNSEACGSVGGVHSLKTVARRANEPATDVAASNGTVTGPSHADDNVMRKQSITSVCDSPRALVATPVKRAPDVRRGYVEEGDLERGYGHGVDGGCFKRQMTEVCPSRRLKEN